jgi:DNA polymerase-3 subunit gamma/tau
MTIRFATAAENGDDPAMASTPPPPQAPSGRALLEEDPMVRKVVELFEARPVHLEVEEDATRPSHS